MDNRNLKASELRIGNLIIRDKHILHVQFIDRFGKINQASDDKFNPIPLTEEWLLNLGFKRTPANNSIYLPIPQLKAEIHFELFRGVLVCVLYCSTGSFIPSDIKYVHALQNLYQALTGTELTLTQSDNENK